MGLMLRRIIALICLLSALAPQSVGAALSLPDKDLADDLIHTYNLYSQYLDTQWTGTGWNYSVPSRHYQETGRDSTGNLRMQATLAAYYRFRTDNESGQKIREAILGVLGPDAPMVNSVKENGKTVSTRSFHDMIGLYLALQILKERADVFSWIERVLIIGKIEQIFPWALSGFDNENRALLAASYGLAILQHPLTNFSPADQKKYKKQIRDKVKIGLTAIDSFGVYHEGFDKQYSLHYHLVSALMLSYLGQNLSDKQYAALSKKMLKRIHDWYKIGKLHWIGSARPTGIGLQTVLLRALGEKYLGNKNWLKYWQTEKKNRGFIDSANPKRLVWKDDVDRTLNDDYSFINMAELLFLENN